MNAPEFSIITPSFNMAEHLQCCHASIADQQGVRVEHIVADGGSSDGTVEWLREHPEIASIVGPDRGMYDAINKGLRIAQGRYVGYLNCDEQYLPGALQEVARVFEQRRSSDVDAVYGDALVIGPEGQFLAYRKAYTPLSWFILTSHLYLLTCAIFWRRVDTRTSLHFDDALKDLGDADFVLRLLARGARFAHCRRYLAAFTMTGSNRSLGANAKREVALLAQRMPMWMRWMKYPITAVRFAYKVASGCYSQPSPIRYALYTRRSPAAREELVADRVTFRWPRSEQVVVR